MSALVSDNLQPAYLKATEEFSTNPGQWKAYESIGNCVVLAGPGSGKTKLLTTKMARIIHEDIKSPQGVACITYSTECARELKKRLDVLGISEKRNVFIGTVHGFCLNHIIRPYTKLADYPISDPIVVADSNTWEKVFIDSYRQVGIRDPRYLKTTFERYRRTHLERADKTFYADSSEMAALIDCFEENLHAAGYIDFDDMALIGLRLIKQNEWIRKALKARFPVLIIDEYQDLGEVLHQIVLHMAFATNVRILAVGDPDQSIYGFAGAKPHLLRELSEHEKVEKVELGFNYRCAKKIVANSILALGEKRDYQAIKDEEGEFYFWECPDGIDHQAEVICSEIIPLVLSQSPRVNLGDIAVLYLDKNDAARITATAKKHGYQYIGGDRETSFRQTPVTRWLEDCAAWCSDGWRDGKPRLSQIINFWLNVYEIQGDVGEMSSKQRLVNFLWKNRGPKQNLKDWLYGILALGLLENLKQVKVRTDEIESLQQLMDLVNDPEKLGNFSIQAFGNLRGSPNHLNLITLHSSKGLEFDVVIIMGLEEGRIPSFSSKTQDQLSEERRKFYVGLTRAKREIHLVYSGWYENRIGKFKNGPSRFVLEQYSKHKECV
jgi:DNA helicase-2/ATP-dependent DNA helicase PcrA